MSGWSASRLGNVAIGMSWGLVGYLLAWGAGVLICIADAAGARSRLPPPASWQMRLLFLGVAVCIGVVAGMASRHWGDAREGAWVAGRLAMVAVMIAAAPAFLIGIVHEGQFVARLPPGADTGSSLRYAHQACNWLATQRWGRSPGPEQLAKRRIQSVIGAIWEPPGGKDQLSNSAKRLEVYYVEHVDSASAAPLTQDERAQVKFTSLAWMQLCPFQLWVHHPIGAKTP